MTTDEMSRPFIMHRGQPLYFTPSHGWHIRTFAGVGDSSPVTDVEAAVEASVNAPVGSPPLNTLVKGAGRVAVLVEDLTRASPKGRILKAVLRVLTQAGVTPEQVKVVIALGTHRGLTQKELEATFGNEVLSQYEVINHDCHAPDLVPAGHLGSGRVVRIHPAVYEADVKIGIGSIFPHPMNGFGGGGKILFPGVSDFDSILAHHFEYTFLPGTGLGKTQGNPFYQSVRDVATSAGLDFIVNSILDRRDQLFSVVAGDPVQAHAFGMERSRSLISEDFPLKADITLTTSFPYTEGPQIVKSLAPAAMVTREGGCIILSAECEGILPGPFIQSFERFHAAYGQNLLQGVLDHFSSGRLIMEGGAVDYNMALGMTLALMDRFKMILVSEDIPKATADKMGFLYARDLDQAFALSSPLGSQPDVHIIAAGGVILPVM